MSRCEADFTIDPEQDTHGELTLWPCDKSKPMIGHLSREEAVDLHKRLAECLEYSEWGPAGNLNPT